MQRRLSLIATAARATGMQRACSLWQHLPQVLWVSDAELSVHSTSLCLPAGKARTVLGREFHLVIFDAWSGLDVNALAAVSGTIRAGGALVLLTPQLDKWAEYPDPDCQRFLPYPWQPEQVSGHFMWRLVRMLGELKPAPENPTIKQESNSGDLLVTPENVAVKPVSWPVQTTADQQQALRKILQAEQPVVLSADRGRGKSAVLGMVAKQLAADGLNVVLTAPSRAAVSSVLQHAEYPVNFYAPDELLQSTPTADVLLIDEAAAIPLPMLLQMLQAYPRCVFATTLQGYEGSGRGFVLRFQRALVRLYPDCLEVKLHQPIRWQRGDGLEAFINRWLIMDYAPVSSRSQQKGFRAFVLPFDSAQGTAGWNDSRAEPFGFAQESRSRSPAVVTPSREDDRIKAVVSPKYQQISQATLSNSELKLREIFQLLVNAHYQTRPSDLRQILDAPHITLHVLEVQQQVVAVAVLAREGGLESELVAEIHAGKRRPQGHLLPQSLTFHAGIAGAACLHCERIMRIAVAPAWQRQGLGQVLLDKLHHYASQQRADYLGVSYALSPEILAFWQRAGFHSVRLGYRKDKASGSRSLMQVLGLSVPGQALTKQACEQFRQNLPDLLLQLDDMSDELAAALQAKRDSA